MNVVSYNLRGCGAILKRKRFSLIKKGKFDLCLVQETKVQNFDSKTMYELWGGSDAEWCFKLSNCISGGMITLWRQRLFDLIFSFDGEGFLELNILWK